MALGNKYIIRGGPCEYDRGNVSSLSLAIQSRNGGSWLNVVYHVSLGTNKHPCIIDARD